MTSNQTVSKPIQTKLSEAAFPDFTCLVSQLLLFIRGKVCAHKTNLNPPRFNEVPASSHESDRSCMFVLGYRFCLF